MDVANNNDFIISDSVERSDYEIMIKQKDEHSFVGYCPQLNSLRRGESFDKVYNLLNTMIAKHINYLGG